MNTAIHYAGAVEYGRTRILAGWAACCSGQRAEDIRAACLNTRDPAKVTCAKCRRIMEKAGILPAAE